MPVGIGKVASVSDPTIRPPARAISTVLAGAATMARSAASSSGRAVVESWGSSALNASTTSAVISLSTSTSTSTGAIYPVRRRHGERHRSTGGIKSPMADKALVLGGGGITGIAWEIGMLAGLAAEHGLDLSDADLVVGTSAGSVVGVDVRSGLGLAQFYENQTAPVGPDEVVARMGL